MKSAKHAIRLAFFWTVAVMMAVSLAFCQAAPPTARAVGSVKAVTGNTITITTDAGAEMTIGVDSSTRMVRIAPGQRDLKSATPIQLSGIQPGDRIAARGSVAADQKSLTAASILVMKQADVAQKQEQDREDWHRRGVGGLVKAVDAASGTVTISNGPNTTMTVHAGKSTIIRRYSPDSVKFDDAKPASLSDIKPGDQLRARGERSADGSELNADEIVSGTFRNIAGTVIATDPATNSVTVKDLATKKPVTIKVSGDSQLRQLPAPMAQRLAMRLKHVTPEAKNTSTGEGGNSASVTPSPQAQPEHPQAGHGDLQQMLNRMPPVSITDLQKGEAVIVVATEGSAASAPTVITLLTGVEPILSASPNDNRATTLLSPWSIGGSVGEESQ